MNPEEIETLIASGAAEHRALEFKQAVYGRNNEAIRELLKDITAMANTKGGDILLGVKEADSRAAGFVDLTLENFDTERGRMTQLLKSHVDPPIFNVEISLVSVDGHDVIAIAIPKSWSGPHRVKFNDQSHFYVRTSHGNEEMDTGEIRQSFLLSEEVPDRMRRFRAERVALIAAGEAPVPLQYTLQLIVHIIPRSAFTDRTHVDLTGLYTKNRSLGRIQFYLQTIFAFDGLLAVAEFIEKPQRAYVQVMRSGIYEAVWSIPPHRVSGDVDVLNGATAEEYFVEEVEAAVPAMRYLGIDKDLFVCLSLAGTNGIRMANGNFTFDKIRRNELVLPEVELQTTPADRALLRNSLNLPLDVLWQSAGAPKSPLMSKDGVWSV